MNNYITNVEIEEDRVVVFYKESSNEMLLTYPPQAVPDRVWKNVWVIKDGKLVFLKRVDGRVEPEQTTPEKITFPE